MAINIYTVQQDVEEKGWTLVSTTYKNLKTPIQLICPKGHNVEITYEEWRKHQLCPECEKIIIKNNIRNIIPPANPNANRILALDAATGKSGYSIYDDRQLIAYGTFSTSGVYDSTERINQVKKWVKKICDIAKPDAIGIENIQYQQFSGVKTFQTLANLQGVLLDFCYENSFKYELASSSTWRAYIGINHGDKRETAKRQAQAYIKMNFGFSVTEDEADAICLGKYFCSRFGKPTWGEGIE